MTDKITIEMTPQLVGGDLYHALRTARREYNAWVSRTYSGCIRVAFVHPLVNVPVRGFTEGLKVAGGETWVGVRLESKSKRNPKRPEALLWVHPIADGLTILEAPKEQVHASEDHS